MNIRETASKIHGFLKTKPRKRRMAFFLLLGIVLALGFSAYVSLAAKTTYSAGEISDLKTAYKLSDEQITNLQNSGLAYSDFEKKVNNLMKYNSYKNLPGEAARSVLYDIENPGTAVDVLTGNKALDDEAAKQAAARTIGTVLAPIISALTIVSMFLKLFVAVAAYFLTSMLDPTLYNFMGDKMIVQGWTAVRDVCNLFFLLVLLFIAFCTILQIEKYHAKKTLLTFILMAMLINFSKPIAIFIFDGSQLLMNFFLNKIGTNFTDKLGGLSKIAELIYDKLPRFLEVWNPLNEKSNIDLAVQAIFSVIFLFMYGVALFVMALYLLIRIVAIQILIILAPFAFLFNAIPDFKKISSDWWDTLFKYSYVGPVIAFFLWLVTLSEFTKRITDTASFSMPAFIAYMFVLVFLYASIIVANKFGIQFASAITNRANKALNWGARNLTGYNALKWGAKKGAQWFDREVLTKGATIGGKNIPLSYRAWKEGWAQKTKERESVAYGEAGADVMDRLSESFKKGKKPKDFYRRRFLSQEVAKYEKEQEMMGTSDDICLKGLDDLENMEMGTERTARGVAFLKTLYKNRNFNEYKKKTLGEAMEGDDAYEDLGGILKKHGVGGDDLNWFREQFSDMAQAAGDFHLMGSHIANKDQRRDFIAGKMGTVDNQQFQIKIHPEAILKINAKGEIKGVSENADLHINHLI